MLAMAAAHRGEFDHAAYFSLDPNSKVDVKMPLGRLKSTSTLLSGNCIVAGSSFLMTETPTKIRIGVVGAGEVGKTALIQRVRNCVLILNRL